VLMWHKRAVKEESDEGVCLAHKFDVRSA
jgi:hypothetical protein